MRIAIHGSGRMGAAVREVCEQRGHTVAAIHDRGNPLPERVDVDAIIDFSNAEAIERVTDCAIASSVLLITGTTGWSEDLDRIRAKFAGSSAACVYASNFSIGANVLFALAERAAKQFASVDGYASGIEERHHARKKDAPSGTALSLAGAVKDGSGGALDPPIVASRVGEEFGLHTVFFDSADDVIELVHRARGRTGFARGAVVAAERALGRSGWIDLRSLLFDGGS